MLVVTSFYTNFNNIIHNFIFIKYENYMKVIYNRKSVIISLDKFIKYKTLFQIYFISLICTKNSNNLVSDYYWNDNRIIYGSLSRHYNFTNNRFNDNFSFNYITKYSHKNPLNSNEPKRETSMKKQNKLLKTIYYDLNGFNPVQIIDDIIYS